MKDFFNKHRQIIIYIFFGVLTTLVSWGSYALLVRLFALFMSDDAAVFISNLLSWILGVAFAYVTNKIWVFNSRSWAPKLVLREAASFVASRAVTGVLEVFGVPLLAKTGFDGIFYSMCEKAGVTADVFYTKGIYSKIAFAFVVIVLNYVFSKLIVFKKDKSE